ncbi:hypothetical protein [Desulfococcus multivorans]|uniref:Uncharacterized protein n=1 Tax=Desulfococcus multivorans DSM 2059 TaxID=1121405 RepID=S7UXW7_DESML|nr:hypothetical protein [Desulfococcus multivorans]EPR39089.1 hypothetical protein dsmv_2838 [Desulfococcus multivorans DSM 2059]
MAIAKYLNITPFGALNCIRFHGAVVNDEHILTLVIGQSVENAENSYREHQQQPAPILCAAFEQVISGILADDSLVVGHNAPEKIFAEKRQGKYCFYQRTNTVPMMFSNTTLVKQRVDPEMIKKS